MMRGFVTDCDCYLSDIVPLNVHVPGEADIFGTQSRLITGSIGMPQPVDRLSWVNNIAYEGAVILIFALFCFLLYNFRGDILQLFRYLTLRASSEKIYAEQRLFFKRFITLSTLLGMLLISGLGVKLGDYFGLDALPFTAAIPDVKLIPAMLLLAPAAVWLYRYLATGIVGGVTRNRAFFSSYRFMSHLSGSVSFLILTPFFLLFALGEERSVTFLIYLTITIASLLYLLYLGNSYRFFIEQNVSILQWILYLCTVEWFPVSLLLLEAVRMG